MGFFKRKKGEPLVKGFLAPYFEKSSILYLVFIVIQISMIVSYPHRPVLVVSDPYIEEVGLWPIGSRFFHMGAQLLGFRIIKEYLDDNNTLTKILEKLDTAPEIAVLSPWTVSNAGLASLVDSKIIIAGGNPSQDYAENIIEVVMDPFSAREEAGQMAGNIALKEQKPALILYQGNIDALLEAYELASRGEFPLLKLQLSDDAASLPKEFRAMAAEASVLLLFAGPLNIEAFKITQNTQQPVITEFALVDGPWNNRIVASIENNNLIMGMTVLAKMLEKTPENVTYYPGRLKSSKKWFDVIRQTIL